MFELQCGCTVGLESEVCVGGRG